jgi:hypothetical protein
MITDTMITDTMITDTTTASRIDAIAASSPTLLTKNEVAAVGGGSWFSYVADTIVDFCGGFLPREH